MAPHTIAIIGENDDFCAVLAEHAERELGVKVERVPTAEKAKASNIQRIISQSQWEAQKPLKLQDLLINIQTQFAREEWPIGGAQFSVQQKTIVNRKKSVSLTDKEAQLLTLLLKHTDGVEKDRLLKEVWGVETELESHTLETHVYRLRAKLKDAGVTAIIAAEPGKYRLEV